MFHKVFSLKKNTKQRCIPKYDGEESLPGSVDSFLFMTILPLPIPTKESGFFIVQCKRKVSPY